jgi:hypothetical protein
MYTIARNNLEEASALRGDVYLRTTVVVSTSL